MAIKRSEFAIFMDTTPNGSTHAFNRLGKGVTTGAWAYNKQVTTETYIHEDSATTIIESEQPQMSVAQKAYKGDPIFEFVDSIRRSHATGEDCETEVVLVYIYDATGTDTITYGAEKIKVAIQVDDFGGDGGSSNVLNYTILGVGEATQGSATISNGVATFTANS